MTRYSEHDTRKIYETAQSLRVNCPLRDGLVPFPETSVWRSEVLDRIRQAFVATPDDGSRAFIGKLKNIAVG